MKRPRLLDSFAALVLLGLCAAVVAAAKPPKNPPPLPPPPPVQYALKTFQMPVDVAIVETHQMTSSGVVVGAYITNGIYHPFLYDPAIDPDVAIDLNDIGVAGLDEGWRIAAALDINERGFVVGPIEDVNNPGIGRGYLLDLNEEPPQLWMLPDEGLGDTYARRINDNMDILGVSLPNTGVWRGYHYNPNSDADVTDLGFELFWHQVELSNPPAGVPAQVVGQRNPNGTVFRYTIGYGMEPDLALPEGNYRLHPYDISPNGEFCGGYPKPKTRNAYMAYRYDDAVETFSNLATATAIDGHGDFVAGPMLYHEGTGAFNLDGTLGGSASDLSIWNDSAYPNTVDMTERGAINPDAPNFPGMCGYLYSPSFGYRGFVLIPVATAP